MINRAQALKQQLPLVRAVVKGQGDTAQLRTLLTEAMALNTRSLALSEWGAGALLLPKAIAIDAAKLCQGDFEKLAKSTGAIIAWKVDGDKLQLKGALTDSKSALEQILTVWQRAWTASIGNEFAGLDDLARLIEDVKGGKDAADKLKQAGMLGQQLVRGVPTPDPAVRDKVVKARQLLQEALKLLAKSGGGNEVVEFLGAVAKGNCTLALVNEKILNWLNTNGQLAKFRVLRSTSGSTGF
jgi:hypothetical protein